MDKEEALDVQFKVSSRAEVPVSWLQPSEWTLLLIRLPEHMGVCRQYRGVPSRLDVRGGPDSHSNSAMGACAAPCLPHTQYLQVAPGDPHFRVKPACGAGAAIEQYAVQQPRH